MRFSYLGGFLLSLAIVVTCGGSSTTGSKCTPGMSTACSGAGACSGSQTCKTDGTFAPCDCGMTNPDGGMTTDAGADGETDSGVDSGVDSGADSGTFSVKSLPGLALWLDASAGLIADAMYQGHVKSWLDQSGHG